MYHVMSRGDRREKIFLDDIDRQDFIKTLAEARQKTGWQVHAYCLMPNHYHVALETPEPNLVAGMAWLQSTYTIRLNHRHKLIGHVLSGRYKAQLVEGSGNGYLKTARDYVHLNPVRAHLLKTEERLLAYPWSSLGAYIATPEPRPFWIRVDRLLGEHGIQEDSAPGRQQFEQLMETRRFEETDPEACKALRRGWFLGSEAFKREMLSRMEGGLGGHHVVSLVSGTAYRSDFSYDGLGRLRIRTDYYWGGSYRLVSAITRYIYDRNRVIQERDGSYNPLVSYTRGSDLSGSLEGAGGIGGLLARSDGYSSGNWTNHNYYFADGNGNITYMINSSQAMVASYRYDPYGNTISSSGSLSAANVYRFSSKEIHVNSGMYYYLYRFYDPNLQRWINRDPLAETEGINLYGFVRNRPTSLADSDGRQCWGYGGGCAVPPPPSAPPGSSPSRPKPPGSPPFFSPDGGNQVPGLVLNCFGNAPPADTGKGQDKCDPSKDKPTPPRPSKPQQIECPGFGMITVPCTEHKECKFFSMNLNTGPVYTWQTVHDCPCPTQIQ